MNGPAVFLSCTWTDEAVADVIEQALRDRGLTVLRDKDMNPFGDVTGSVRRAVDSSVVLVAFYSRRYHDRFSCQWALTRAFLAGRRRGDVRDRVLIVNPEPDDRHMASRDLADACQFTWKTESDAGPLADVVRGRADRADRVAEPADRLEPVGGRLPAPRIPVGRYREMWTVHSELTMGAVVITGAAGAGKTALAEQYSVVFRDAYPGGVIWTSMAGVDQPLAVNRVARERFGLELSGMRTRQAMATIAERVDDDVLWVIDDVPGSQASNDLLAPSAKVRTLLTMRTVPSWWPGGRVDLTADEPQPEPVIRSCGEHARTVLGFASLLAKAPISGALMVNGMSGVFGQQAPTLLADALSELDQKGLVVRLPGTGPQSWRTRASVADGLDQDAVRPMAERAARSLMDVLPTGSLDDCTHALALATIPLPARLSLLRAVVTTHEEHGDVPAARYACGVALAITWEKWHAEAAARLALAEGDAKDALCHTEVLIDRARDVRSEFHARLIAATAHDILGEYTNADEIFHGHSFVRRHGRAPAWLSEVERQRAVLALVRAHRSRGEYCAAWELIEALRHAEIHKGIRPAALVELARVQLSNGQAAEAVVTARRVHAEFADAGAARHHVAREAATVLAESELAMALTETGAAPNRLTHVTSRVQYELRTTTEWYGADSPLSLELMVLYGRSLVGNGEHEEAFDVLAAARRRTTAVHGAEHPITLRAIQWAGVATMGRGEWKAAAAVFERLLPRQTAVLGDGHPECQLTRFHLSTCLLRQNKVRQARPFLDAVLPALRDRHGPLRQWAATSGAGRARS